MATVMASAYNILNKDPNNEKEVKNLADLEE